MGNHAPDGRDHGKDSLASAQQAIVERWPGAEVRPEMIGRAVAVGAKKVRHAAVSIDGTQQVITLEELTRVEQGQRRIRVGAFSAVEPQGVQFAYLADPNVLRQVRISDWLKQTPPETRESVKAWWGQAVSMAIAGSLARYPKGPCIVLMECRSMLAAADGDTELGFVFVTDSRLNQGWGIRCQDGGSPELWPVRYDRAMLAASVPVAVPELTVELVDQINRDERPTELVQIPTTRGSLRAGLLLVPDLLQTAAETLIAAIADSPSLDPGALGTTEFSDAAEEARGYRERLESAAQDVLRLGAFAGVTAAPAVLAHLDALVAGEQPQPRQ